jgi:hypothetical protein
MANGPQESRRRAPGRAAPGALALCLIAIATIVDRVRSGARVRPASCVCTGCNRSGRVALLLVLQRKCGGSPARVLTASRIRASSADAHRRRRIADGTCHRPSAGPGLAVRRSFVLRVRSIGRSERRGTRPMRVVDRSHVRGSCIAAHRRRTGSQSERRARMPDRRHLLAPLGQHASDHRVRQLHPGRDGRWRAARQQRCCRRPTSWQAGLASGHVRLYDPSRSAETQDVVRSNQECR